MKVRHGKLIWGLACLLLAALAPLPALACDLCGTTGLRLESVLATAAGEDITLADVQFRARILIALGEIETPIADVDALRESLTETLIAETELLAKAARKGIVISLDDVDLELTRRAAERGKSFNQFLQMFLQRGVSYPALANWVAPDIAAERLGELQSPKSQASSGKSRLLRALSR